jgi:uncharacterized protein YutD
MINFQIRDQIENTNINLRVVQYYDELVGDYFFTVYDMDQFINDEENNPGLELINGLHSRELYAYITGYSDGHSAGFVQKTIEEKEMMEE